MFKRLLSFSLIWVSLLLVWCKNQISDTVVSENTNPINLSWQYEVKFVLNNEDYIQQVDISTKEYGSWSITWVELDSMEFFTWSIIWSMYYFPSSWYVFFTMEDGMVRPFRTFTKYKYYTDRKELIALKPEDSCVPFDYSLWSGSESIVYWVQQWINFDNGLYQKEVRCDLKNNQYVTKNIADQSIWNNLDIEKIREYYRYLSNKQRDKFSNHHRLKDWTQQTSDQVKKTYNTAQQIDLIDIKPVEWQENMYTITVDLVTKYAISRYINTKQVITSWDTRYIKNKDTIDSFHIPNLSSDSYTKYESNEGDECDMGEWSNLSVTENRDDIIKEMQNPPYKISEWNLENLQWGLMCWENWDITVFWIYNLENTVIKFAFSMWHDYPSDLSSAGNIETIYYSQHNNKFYRTSYYIGRLSEKDAWQEWKKNLFYDSIASDKLYMKDWLYPQNWMEERYKQGSEMNDFGQKMNNSQYFKTLKTRFWKATEDMRKKSLWVE